MVAEHFQTLDLSLFDAAHESLVAKHAPLIQHKAQVTALFVDLPGCHTVASCQHLPWEAQASENKTR